MTISPQRLIRQTAIPFVCACLVILFVSLQMAASGPTAGGLAFLRPAETTSPRATLEGFRADASRASILLMEAHRQNRSEPSLTWSQGVAEKVAEAEALLARAARALDLSEVPPVELEHRRLEATLLLKEVLDRVPLPDSRSIPGNDETASAPLPNWTVPGTDIRIVRVSNGSRAGEYLFSGDSLSRLSEFYRQVRGHPNSSGGSEDFYDFFSLSPGYLLPPKWYGLIEALPPFWRMEIKGQALWQWMGLAVVIALSAFAVAGIARLVRDGKRSGDATASVLAHIVLPSAVAVAALFVRYLADRQINLTGTAEDIIEGASYSIAYAAAIWGVLRFSNTLAGKLAFPRWESIDAHLARAAVRISGLAIAIALLIYGASYLGIPLAGLLAGLGVGGLAVALAAKPTLENFIGGLILYADRPVRVGDLCRFGNLEGRVEEIGIRSTRIRGLDRALITIPNATFANMNIVNLTNRDRMPYDRTVGLQATESAAIRQEIDAFAALVAGHPKIEPGSVQARLREGQEENPKVEISALILTSRWDEFLRIQQEIDLLLRDGMVAARRQSEGPPEEASNVYPLKDAEEENRKALASP